MSKLRGIRILINGVDLTAHCDNCERCTWNPGPDCERADHEQCPTCGHCLGRHEQALPTSDTPR